MPAHARSAARRHAVPVTAAAFLLTVFAAVGLGCSGSDGGPEAAGKTGADATTTATTTVKKGVDRVATNVTPPGSPVTAPNGTTPALIPPFVFEPAAVDFGFVAIGEPMEATVKVRNVSDAPLKILTMKPDCQCTTVQDLSNEVIPVGGEIEFTALIDGRDAAGRKSNEIKFVFEGWDEVASLGMTSVVTRAVRTEPGYISALGDITKGVMSVGALDRRPFRILSANGKDVEYADGYNPATDEPQYLYKVGWDLSGYDATTCLNASGERMPKWVVFETDHPDAPVVDVRVRHECTRVATVKPGQQWVLSRLRANLEELAPHESGEFEVDLKWLRGAAPSDTIREVRSESDQFSVTVVKMTRVEDRITARIRVTPAPGHRGLLYGSMRFYAFTPGHSWPMTIIGRVADTDVVGMRDGAARE